MIAIDQLRYVRLGTRDLPAAIDFAERLLGLQLVDRTEEAAYFRSDMRDHTLVFFLGEPTERAVGFEIHGQAQFDAAITELSQHGIEAAIGTEQACAARKVRALASFRDPDGNMIELVLRPLHSGWRYFPPRDAGIVGLKGVALRSRDVPACEALVDDPVQRPRQRLGRRGGVSPVRPGPPSARLLPFGRQRAFSRSNSASRTSIS